ncbi:hypothetical protein B296_00032239, partial [Ensete ventricosum]
MLVGWRRTRSGAEGLWPLWSGRSRSMAKEGILAQVGLLLPLLALTVILVFFLTVAKGGNSGGAGDELALVWIPIGSNCHESIMECLAGDEFDLGADVGQMTQVQPIMGFSEAHGPEPHLY